MFIYYFNPAPLSISSYYIEKINYRKSYNMKLIVKELIHLWVTPQSEIGWGRLILENRVNKK